MKKDNSFLWQTVKKLKNENETMLHQIQNRDTELETAYSDIRELSDEIDIMAEAMEFQDNIIDQRNDEITGLRAIIATQEARLDRDLEIIEVLR